MAKNAKQFETFRHYKFKILFKFYPDFKTVYYSIRNPHSDMFFINLKEEVTNETKRTIQFNRSNIL